MLFFIIFEIVIDLDLKTIEHKFNKYDTIIVLTKEGEAINGFFACVYKSFFTVTSFNYDVVLYFFKNNWEEHSGTSIKNIKEILSSRFVLTEKTGKEIKNEIKHKTLSR